MENSNVYYKKYLKYKKKYTELKHQMMGGNPDSNRVAKARALYAGRGGPKRKQEEELKERARKELIARAQIARAQIARAQKEREQKENDEAIRRLFQRAEEEDRVKAEEEARVKAEEEEFKKGVGHSFKNPLDTDWKEVHIFNKAESGKKIQAVKDYRIAKKARLESEYKEKVAIYESSIIENTSTDYKKILRAILRKKWEEDNKPTYFVKQIGRRYIGTKRLENIKIKECVRPMRVYDQLEDYNFKYTDNYTGKIIEIKINEERVRRVIFRFPINIKYIFAGNSEEIKSTMINYQIIFQKNKTILNIMENSIDLKDEIWDCK